MSSVRTTRPGVMSMHHWSGTSSWLARSRLRALNSRSSGISSGTAPTLPPKHGGHISQYRVRHVDETTTIDHLRPRRRLEGRSIRLYERNPDIRNLRVADGNRTQEAQE